MRAYGYRFPGLEGLPTGCVEVVGDDDGSTTVTIPVSAFGATSVFTRTYWPEDLSPSDGRGHPTRAWASVAVRLAAADLRAALGRFP